MIVQSRRNEVLLKRVADLVKDNKDLEEQLREVTKKYDDILERYLELNKSIEDKSTNNHNETENHQRFDMVTVLFANVHGFSKVSKNGSARDLMDELDQIFLQFDEIAKDFNIKRVKSIGDTYLCAGGIPDKNITNPVEVVLAALQMNNLIEEIENHYNHDHKIWDLCFGIHTGPVLADVNGKKKISYDIKGDTVNIATRMESIADLGKIIISETTYEFVKEIFECVYVGKLPVKFKGDIVIYEVLGLKSEYCSDKKGIEPNNNFFIKFLSLQLIDIEQYLLAILEKDLSADLHYHNVKHTVDVVTQVELIGIGEGLNDEELILIKTAALFHDTGYMFSFINHEEESARYAREILPRYRYSPDQIDEICEIIMATKYPPQPKNKLQRIICDADLDYLGRSDFIPVSNLLFEELKQQNKINSLSEWNEIQIKFISKHQYYTDTARRLREINKQNQIERIRLLINE